MKSTGLAVRWRDDWWVRFTVAAVADGFTPEVQMRKFQKRNQTQESPPVTPAAKQTKEILCFRRVVDGVGCSV